MLEAEEEARLATAIFANSLTHAQTLEGGLAGFSADLLVSTGYDLVALYDPDGHVVLSQGLSGDTAWLPRQDGAGFYMTMAGGTPVLLLGSSHRFLFDGRPY
ncbi:sensor histidine kinase, partial [Roseomonas sp. DSM 102946]|nr:sensor histidine kinase [Roseomonas sp. DSM 102946]